MLEQIMDRRNVEKALISVIRNGGVGGVDGMQTDELRDYLNRNYQTLRKSVLAGAYRPQAVRKVEIPKPGGGVRMLGIPTVLDRVLQQAISQWMNQFYEPTFSEYSYGFRPKRNAHQAVRAAQRLLDEGKTWIVELDLEKFFDRVNHDKLMSLITRRISDQATLKLIRQYLESDIMEAGVQSQRLEGTPQGSPLSPLLSNIMLHELDVELTKRGHSIVRYADDCSIYVRSEKSAHRVLENITKYIENELRLKVNRTKSKISRPSKSTLLGFSFYCPKGRWTVRIAEKSLERMKAKCKLITSRSKGGNIHQKLGRLTPVIRGWVNYFCIAAAGEPMRRLDELIRTRLRMCIWKEWKNGKTRVRNLLRLGAKHQKAYEWGNSSKGYCRIAQSPILKTLLNNGYLSKLGYQSLLSTYKAQTEMQPTLF